MFKKWSRAYRTISGAHVEGDFLVVEFANSDVAKVRLSALAPSRAKQVGWRDARVETNGLYVRVPADPQELEIPWDVIRNQTDPEFARQMVELAEEQARYIGTQLRELRARRGLTQAKIASVTGIEPANISRIEHGHFDVSTSTLWKMLAAMGSSPSDLAVEWHSTPLHADAKGRSGRSPRVPA